MTKQQLQRDYPNTWRSFSKYFDREGWGADSASNLSDFGFNQWFPDFLYEYGIDSIDQYENNFENLSPRDEQTTL